MAKVTIGGEVFEFDVGRKPMEEALAIEDALKIPYVQYEQGLNDGSARSLAGFVWLVWRRNGRDVPLADILSGKVDVDLAGINVDDGDGEAADDEAGPTTPTPPVSSTTGGGTSVSSRKSSGSSPGRSRS